MDHSVKTSVLELAILCLTRQGFGWCSSHSRTSETTPETVRSFRILFLDPSIGCEWPCANTLFASASAVNLCMLAASQGPSRTRRAAADPAWAHCESPRRQAGPLQFLCRCHPAASDAPTSQRLRLHMARITLVLRITHKTCHPALSHCSASEHCAHGFVRHVNGAACLSTLCTK